MSEQVFVARERELARLDAMLAQALAGEAQIGFIIGEAGAGKTTLLHEWVRRAEDAHADLVVATGACNAQTGGGDPYLPFREILALLTGDIESKVAQKEVSSKTAGRLKGLLRASGATLLQFGPDLIGTFIPGASLAARVAAHAAGEMGLTDALKKEAEKNTSGKVELDQGKILEQYASVLQALAKQSPLVLVIDDLQWADNASITLLFHLTRQLAESRILVLGAYRSDDVAVGRDGGRHPLEQVVNEIRRYRGDILVDLTEARIQEGHRFVDELLDAEPNTFDGAFRRALYQHTGGHPLFTVELLHTLQDRGAIVRDAAGRWTVSLTLNWETLPARVEGVIAERITRLPDELRDILAVAGVEGQDFTVKILSQVQGVSERDVLKTLARELAKRHRLVEETSESRAQGQFLTRYRFTNTPIQQYVYNDLSLGERRFLHRAIAEALEALYEGRTAEILVKLAQHYEQAGLTAKAAEYLSRAGLRAYGLSAFQEAQTFQERALALATEPEDRPWRVTLTRQLALVLLGRSDLTGAKARMEESLALAREIGDKAGIAAALSGLGRIATEMGAYAEAKARLAESLPLARELGDKAGLAPVLKDLGMAVGWLGQYEDSKRYLAEGLALARELGDRSLMSSALNHLGHITQDQHQFEEATVYLEESLALSRESGDRVGATVALFNLGAIAMQTGASREAVTHAQESLALAREVGSRSLTAAALSLLGLIACDQGPAGRRAALPYLQEALTIAMDSRAAPFALYAFFGFAKLRAREGQAIPAVELLGLVLHHPALIQGVRDLAEPLLAELEAALPSPDITAAQARGQAWTLEEAARLVLEAQPVAAG